jgi:hypothetical protein
MRQREMYPRGDSPTSSVKRAANAERGSPTARARPSTVHLERFLKLRLRTMMVPAALSVALTGCRSQIPPKAGPYVAQQPDAAKPVENFQEPRCVAIYSAPVKRAEQGEE